MNNYEKEVLAIIQNKALTYQQQTSALAKYAENLLPYPLPEGHPFYELYNEGIICDLWEGHAPYAPRYILPDYEKLMREGSAFLRLDPPETLREAIATLLIFYAHVPSITRYPVYIGNIDKLLEPYVQKTDEAVAREEIKWFFIQLDRTINDSFCHANIGPEKTKAGQIMLELLPELQNVTPNMTLKYDAEVTDDSFAALAISSALECANPAFSNHKAYCDLHKGDYGIASCYNALPKGGGAYTLTRMRLQRVANISENLSDFYVKLKDAIQAMNEFIEHKIDFLVKETPFFTSNFLVKEGFISQDRFVGLFGMVGLDDCVDLLMKKEGKSFRYGIDEEANELGIEILKFMEKEVYSFESKYSPLWNHHNMLHAQVGAQEDENNTAGARVNNEKELALYDHIRQAATVHPFFPSGVGDYYPFEETAKRNPEAILDIYKAAFNEGMHFISCYGENSDLVRVTGYLVKKSDLEKYESGEQVSYDTVQYARDAVYEFGILDRKTRHVRQGQ